MATDNWVNLNDVYVSANGGSVNGDLGVKGTLTIDDKTGNNTTYDIASEITALRDSISQTAYNVEPNNSKITINSCIKICGIVLITGMIDASSSGWFECKMNNMPIPITDSAVNFARYQDWGNPGITATMAPDGNMIIQVTTAFPNKIPWSCIFVCK